MSNKQRKAVHAYVSDEAREGLAKFSAEHGLTMSAVLDSFGRLLAGTPAEISTEELIDESRRYQVKQLQRSI